MASMDKQKQIEDKKQELLRRIADKKKNEQSKQPSVPLSSDGTKQTASKSGVMFLNDGNFLARFQAMQQRDTQGPSGSSTTTTASDSRPTVSMKLTTVKSTMPIKPVAARPDIFEAPEDVEENGKFEIFEASILLSSVEVVIVEKKRETFCVWCDFDLAKCLKMF